MDDRKFDRDFDLTDLVGFIKLYLEKVSFDLK